MVNSPLSNMPHVKIFGVGRELKGMLLIIAVSTGLCISCHPCFANIALLEAGISRKTNITYTLRIAKLVTSLPVIDINKPTKASSE